MADRNSSPPSTEEGHIHDKPAAKGSGLQTTTALLPTHNLSHDGDSATDQDQQQQTVSNGITMLEESSTKWYSYLTTVDFYVVVLIGQVLSLCITATNTFSGLLSGAGVSIPAFQTIFNYVLVFLIFTLVFIVREGPKAWFVVLYKNWWKYLLMSFMDVEGNYFTVLAYRYTNILSAQLINFWSIVCVVIVSFLLLKVRYKPFQILGILVCCGGMGILLASDHITGSNGGPGVDRLKGDLFALLGATFYGLSNVFEEWLVSKAPMYQVLSYMGFFGIIINGVQAAIFDRHSFQQSHFDGQVIGWIVGYTICLTLFYSLAPLILRMGSAAFFDISLLTANFWGVIIGIHVFGLKIHYLYPIAFVLIIIGLITYFLSGSMLGDSKKPWLGDNQEGGVAGVGTAKLRAINAAKKAAADREAAMEDAHAPVHA